MMMGVISYFIEVLLYCLLHMESKMLKTTFEL